MRLFQHLRPLRHCWEPLSSQPLSSQRLTFQPQNSKTQPQKILWLSSEGVERGPQAWRPALVCLQGLWPMRRLLARRDCPGQQRAVPASSVGLGWRSLSCGGVAVFGSVLFGLPMSTVHLTQMQALNRELGKLCSDPPQQALSVCRLHARLLKAF